MNCLYCGTDPGDSANCINCGAGRQHARKSERFLEHVPGVMIDPPITRRDRLEMNYYRDLARQNQKKFAPNLWLSQLIRKWGESITYPERPRKGTMWITLICDRKVDGETIKASFSSPVNVMMDERIARNFLNNGWALLPESYELYQGYSGNPLNGWASGP